MISSRRPRAVARLRRSFRACYLVSRTIGPLHLRFFSDYPVATASRVSGEHGYSDNRAEGSTFLIRSRRYLTGAGKSTRRTLKNLWPLVEESRLLPGSLGTGSTPFVALAEEFRYAVAAGDYCVGMDTSHAIVIDFKNRMAWEACRDKELLAMRRRESRYAVGPLARLILPGIGAAQIHAAGIVLPSGIGLLAVGPSGAGKTTLARLAAVEGCRVVSDDRVTVWHREDSFVMAPGADQTTLHPPSAPCPIGAIISLSHGTRQRISPVKWTGLLSEVWRDNRGQWSILPPVLRCRLYETYCRLFSGLPCYRLCFRAERLNIAMLAAAAQGLCAG